MKKFMKYTMNEIQFLNFYKNLKKSGKTDKEVEAIIFKWVYEGDENGMKLVLV